MVKEVLPSYISVSTIRSFEDLCKYVLFPFMQLRIPKGKEMDNDTSDMLSPCSDESNLRNPEGNKSQIDIW